MSVLLRQNFGEQVAYLDQLPAANQNIPAFSGKADQWGFFPLTPTGIDIFQLNIGKMCNQTCKHCHVDAGPDRLEMMTAENLQKCLDIIRDNNIPTVDITGGAPEMHPRFKWFVEELSAMGKHIMVRCNLTIVLHEDNGYLPGFFAQHGVEVISSLPFYNADRTDRQRGSGVFEKSVKVLRLLNEKGYGKEGSGLKLNLVYNPAGAFLPGNQQTLEQEFKKRLKEDFDIHFNQLFTITNMPMGRFLEYLQNAGKEEEYIEKLVEAFNPAALQGVMCRNTISVGWDGFLFDCDFNQMLDLKVQTKKKPHIDDFNKDSLLNRHIVLNQHCYGCTAGAGSSCGGATV